MFDASSVAPMEVDLNDKRLTLRFNKIVEQLRSNPSASIPQAAPNKGATKGIYRFFHNPKVSPQKLIKGQLKHLQLNSQGTEESIYLCLSDSTELDYTPKRSAENLGPLTQRKRRGLILHNSMVINSLGVPLGLLKQDYIIRTDEGFCKWKQKKNLGIDQKESIKWLNHFKAAQELCEQQQVQMIFVADRESDIMDVYHACQHQNMHYIIRSQHNRCIKDSASKLYSILGQQTQRGTYQIQVKDPKTLKVRQATLAIRFCEITLNLSSNDKCRKHLTPLKVVAIEVHELNPPAQIDQPIRWILLTSLPIANFEAALQVVKFYILRWLIERFHYLLKSGGAKVEDLQIQKKHPLKNAIATYSITVMNIMNLKYMASNQPNTIVSDVGITDLECQVLYSYANKSKRSKIPFDKENPPTVWEFCRVLGSIGGFIPSKRQPLPGLKTLSRALEKFYILLEAYDAFHPKN
jgi:hypothetical protein